MEDITQTPRTMNACISCKHKKRKCDRARPCCSNCSRLGKSCVYKEDRFQFNFSVNAGSSQPLDAGTSEATQKTVVQPPNLGFTSPSSSSNSMSYELPGQPTIDIVVQTQAIRVRTQAMRILRSLDMAAVSAEFFRGTHQRLPALSRSRFYQILPSLNDGSRTDFVMLCLCIYLVQQMPLTETTSMQSSLYLTVKNLIGLLEATDDLSLDILHCRLILTFYELSHGIYTAAYISVATCARLARVLGLHKKPWRQSVGANISAMEEQKRLWWSIVNLDRFIALCNEDSLLVTDNPQGSDPLPVEDMLWLSDSIPADLEVPTLATPAHLNVGEMARECQVAHLTGRIIKHIFDPTPDPTFNAEEAVQLERTLKAFLPLLTPKELNVGKYCGALGISHSAIFILYEFTQKRNAGNIIRKHQILKSMEEISANILNYGMSCSKNPEHFKNITSSPFLSYAYFQAGIIQYRYWRQNNDPISKERVSLAMNLLENIKKCLNILANLSEDWPLLMLPPQELSMSMEGPSP